MKIEIFDVEHGQCALVTADNGTHMLIDCGHNTTTGWRPSAMLAVRGIDRLDRLVISNCDEDHISDLPGVAQHLLIAARQTINVVYLNRNSDITPAVIRAMKAPHALSGSMRILCALLPKFSGFGGLGFPTFGPGTCTFFANRYPSSLNDPTEQGFSNNMSLVTFLHHGDIHIVIPGDLEPKGWRLLLTDAYFRAELARVNVFVASHHGRSSGYFSDVFDHCEPKVVIVSDGEVEYDTQTGVYGSAQASGLMMLPHGPGGVGSAGGLGLASRLGLGGGLGFPGGPGSAGGLSLGDLVRGGLRSAGGLGLGGLLAGVNTRYVLTTRRDTSRQSPAIVIEQQPGQPARITTSREWAVL